MSDPPNDGLPCRKLGCAAPTEHHLVTLALTLAGRERAALLLADDRRQR